MRVFYDISILGMGYVNPLSRTGIFRVIENLAEQLVRHPECETVFFSNWDVETFDYALDYWKSTPAFAAIPFSQPRFLTHKKKVDLELRGYTRSIIHDKLTGVRRIQTILQLKRYKALDWLHKKYNKDLFHPRDLRTADIYHSPFLALPPHSGKKSSKRFFLTCYDLIPILFPQYCNEDVIELIEGVVKSIGRETWVLCISHSTRNDLLNYLGNKVDPAKVIVTELAASAVFYRSTDQADNKAVRSKYGIPDEPYILSLCTLEPRKNIDQVINAFVHLVTHERLPALNLVLVGNKGWKFEKIFEEIARSRELQRRIIITGFVADEDLPALYSDALCFVYPSFYEGFGLPPLEAMKCGTPVITSNTSSLPEVVGEAGFTVAPMDTDALCQAMLAIYKSPLLQQELSRKSLTRAGLFSWERCGRETIDAYRASLAG